MADAREASEVAIPGNDIGAVLDGQGGQVRVGCEVAGRTGLAQQASQQSGVPRCRVRGNGCWGSEPRLHLAGRLGDGQWSWEDRRVRADPNEGQERDPRKSNRLRAPERGVEPRARAVVEGALGVDCVRSTSTWTTTTWPSAPLGEATRKHVILEVRGDPQSTRHVGPGWAEAPRRRVRAPAGRGPGSDHIVHSLLERKAALAHRALDEQAGIRVELHGGSHPDARASRR
jgi:hypothetical protein